MILVTKVQTEGFWLRLRQVSSVHRTKINSYQIGNTPINYVYKFFPLVVSIKIHHRLISTLQVRDKNRQKRMMGEICFYTYLPNRLKISGSKKEESGISRPLNATDKNQL